MTPEEDALLRRTAELASAFRRSLPERPVGRPIAPAGLRAALGGALPARGEDPLAVIEALTRGAEPGIVASAGPRYFGFVTGGALPAALAADWLAGAWDQNAWSYAASPAAAVAEEVAAGWLLELLGLPTQASVGFTTGATMATFTALAAGRHALLRAQGYDVEEDGLAAAPALPVIVGDEAHATIFAALQMLGLGRRRAVRVASDAQGRMRPDALSAALAAAGAPALVCAQAGNVNTGAFDPLAPIADAVHEHGGWLHVDGAFGLWAAASPALRALADGAERADSWTLDAHKWLNVPYDCGVAIVRDADAHRAAVSHGAAYYVAATGGERDNHHFVPESSRRARGFAVWAALRSLGREGCAALIERCCALARLFAERLAGAPGVAILNEVVLNQALVRFTPPGGGDTDAFTREVIHRIQADGTCWAGGTTWREQAALRISVSNATTTQADVERSAAAILRCAKA